MVLSGRVTGRQIRTNRDLNANVRMLQAELTDPSDIQSVEHITETGEDSSPPDNSRIIVIPVGEAYKIAIAVDDGIEPEVLPGEKKLYATTQDASSVKCLIYLKKDGTIEISNDAGVSLIISSDGSVTWSAPGDYINDAESIQLNGSRQRLTMWQPLETALQGLITALNGHTHGGSPTPDETFSLDISGAEAKTLQTDG